MKNKVNINNIEYTIYSFIGEVVDNQSYSETHVSGGGGYVNRHGGSFNSVVSNTYTTKDFFLISKTGKEEHFSFTNKPIPAIRSGHIVEVMWAIPEYKSTGKYLIVRNVSLDKNYVDNELASGLIQEKTTGMMHPGSMTWITIGSYIFVVILLVYINNVSGHDYTLYTIPLAILGLIWIWVYGSLFFNKSKKLANELLQELLKRTTISK